MNPRDSPEIMAMARVLPTTHHAMIAHHALTAAGFVLVERPVDGSDRVIRWETTTCPRCLGTDSDRQFCDLCDGSGRGPETVTLHGLEPSGIDWLEYGNGWCSHSSRESCFRTDHEVTPLYKLVPVDTSVPAEPVALPEETQP